MKDKILQILQERHKETGGHSGSTIARICLKMGVEDPGEVLPVLRELRKEDKIIARDGAQGVLLFLRVDDKKQ